MKNNNQTFKSKIEEVENEIQLANKQLDDFADKIKERFKKMYDNFESLNWVIDKLLKESKK